MNSQAMVPIARNRFCSQSGGWQRLAGSKRQRQKPNSLFARGSHSTRRSARKPNYESFTLDCPGIRPCFYSTFAGSSTASKIRLTPRFGTRNNNSSFLLYSKTNFAMPISCVVNTRWTSSARYTRNFSSETTKAAAAASKANKESEEASGSYFGVLFQRLAMSLGIVYVVTEYGIEWTVCEGPSMMPTIKPRGEIVLMDRLTPRLWGLAGGDTIAKREAHARACQERYAKETRQRTKDQQGWLVRLYQKEEERLNKDSINDTNNNSEDMYSKKQILRERREDLERRSNNNKFEETWYETRIPVDKLPPEKAWNRFRTQVTTGISVGDVVVIQHPDRIGTVCKRVMGLPGDIVTKPSSKLGAIRIEDLLHGERGRLSSQGLLERRNEDRLREYQRTKRRVVSSGVQVPDGHIWVEGDNPWNSSDSRNYGAVPASLIMGRVLLRLWPLRGSALMERGSRPIRSESDESSLAFSGSVVIPVGWDDQRILREVVPETTSAEITKDSRTAPHQSPAKQQQE